MDFDFDEAQNAFLNLQEAKKLPPKIEHKLQLLQDCILKESFQTIDPTAYNQLEYEECEGLIKLNTMAQQQMFVSIVQGFAVNSFIPSSIDQIIQGDIDIRTQHLHSWKPKKFKIEVKYKTFEIVRNKKKAEKKNTKPRLIELSYYSVQPQEFKYNRYRFTLKAVKEGHGYYKTLSCGSEDKKLYDKVMEALKTISQFKDHNMRGSIISNKASDFNSLVEQKRKSMQPLIAQSVITVKEEDEYDQRPTGINPASKSEIQASPKKNMLIIKKNPNVPSKLEQQQPYQEQQQQQAQQQQQPQQQQQQQQQQQYQQQQQQQYQYSTPTSQPQPQTSTLATEQIQEQVSPLKLPINPPMPTIEEHLEKPDDGPLNVPVLFQGLLDEGKLSSDYFHLSSKQFTQLYSQNGIQILKSSQKPLCLRAILSVNSTDVERVFQSLAEIEFIKKWNPVLNSTESRFLNLIGSEKSGIIYQKHKPYGMLYLPRDYVYLRFVFKRNDDMVIIDKSIEHEQAPQYLRVIRGDINYQIIQIKKMDNDIQIQIESEITNGGLSSTNQDSGMTQWYLQELKNLNQFIKTYSQSPLIQSPLLTALQTDAQINNEPNQQEIENKTEKQIIVQQQEEETNTNELLKSQIQEIQPVYVAEPPPPPLNHNNQEQINEIQEFNQEFEEIIEQSSYVPSDIVSNTLPAFTADEMEKIKRLIKTVEQKDYFHNCLKYKYQMEPIQAKEEFINEIDGGHYFLRQDWKRDTKKGGMIFYNNKKIENQKRVIKFMIKSIGSNLLSGKSILNISLPVEIFETRSNLERFAYSFTFAPKLLEIGAKLNTSAEQMKYSLAFGVSSIIMYMSLEKPFNPILGETYQGFINGCPVFAEQISHHPPISAFQMKGKGYEIDGHIESTASMHANSVTGKNIGYIRVTYYNTGAKHLFIQCPGIFSGTAFGARVFNISGRGFCVDLENNIMADLAFDPSKSSLFSKKNQLQDEYAGAIYKVKPTAIGRYKKEGYAKYTGLDFNKDIDEKLCDINGIWSENLFANGEQLFNTFEMVPYRMVSHPNPLPSDANYRLDILYWKLQDFDNSMRTKELLEVIQRSDRKWREKLTGKKH